MKKLLLTLIVLMVFASSIPLAMAQDKPAKTSDVLRLELQVLQSLRDSKVNEINRYLVQIEYLKLKIPAVEDEINELIAQIKKKAAEIRAIEAPVPPEPKKE